MIFYFSWLHRMANLCICSENENLATAEVCVDFVLGAVLV